jgi:hypothetical protein
VLCEPLANVVRSVGGRFETFTPVGTVTVEALAGVVVTVKDVTGVIDAAPLAVEVDSAKLAPDVSSPVFPVAVDGMLMSGTVVIAGTAVDGSDAAATSELTAIAETAPVALYVAVKVAGVKSLVAAPPPGVVIAKAIVAEPV